MPSVWLTDQGSVDLVCRMGFGSKWELQRPKVPITSTETQRRRSCFASEERTEVAGQISCRESLTSRYSVVHAKSTRAAVTLWAKFKNHVARGEVEFA